MKPSIGLLRASAAETSNTPGINRWRQHISSALDHLVDLVALLAGGGLLPATGTTTGARPLSGYSTALLETGDEVFVRGVNEVYYFDSTSALTADGLNVVNAVGPGQFIRSISVIVQADWYIDSVAGNDTNVGTAAAPLKTLAELTRRTEGRVLLASITAFNVYLSGSFPTEPLVLNFSVSAYCWVKVLAETRVDYTGSITGYTTYSAGVTAALLDDAAAAFAVADAGKRLRLTSGASAGAVTFVMKQISGTQVRVGDFYHYNATSGFALPTLTATPANGTTYVLEDLTCQVAGLDVVIDGTHAAILIDGVEFAKPPSPITRTSLRLWSTALTTSAKLFGCRMNTTGSNMNLNNSVGVVISCFWRGNGAPIIQDGTIQSYGMMCLAPLQLQANGNLLGQSLYLQSTVATVARNGCLTVSGNFAGYEMSGDAALIVDDGGTAVFTSSTAFWGIGAATSYGIRCRGLGRLSYTVKPTITGSANDTIVGGTATAYAAIPYINPANGCAIVLRA